jgi:hypothetical protein
MPDRQDPSYGWSRPIIGVIAFLGAVDCVVIPFLFVQGQSPIFPLPGLYFIEIALLGLLGVMSVSASADPRSHEFVRTLWAEIPWGIAGVMLAFVILGAWSIGFFLIPAFLAFLIVGIWSYRRMGGSAVRHLGVLVLSAAIQATVMLTAVALA